MNLGAMSILCITAAVSAVVSAQQPALTLPNNAHLSLVSSEVDASEDLPSEIVVKRPGFSPEGLEYDADRDRFLLSSLTEGTIFQVTDDGTITPFIEDETLLSTAGIHIDRERGRLLVTNVEGEAVNRFLTGEPITGGIRASLVAYDIGTGERLFVADLSQVSDIPLALINDVTVDEAGNAYVTNSAAPVIYKVTPQGEASVFIRDERLSAPQVGLNGIDYHPDGFLITALGGNAALIKIPLDDPRALTQVKLETPFVGDGLTFTQSGNLIAVGILGDFANPTPVVFELESSDSWRSATVAGLAEPLQQAATAAVRDETVYVINPHFFEPSVQQYEIVRVEFERR